VLLGPRGHVASALADRRHLLRQKGASHYSYGDSISLIGRIQSPQASSQNMFMYSSTSFAAVAGPGRATWPAGNTSLHQIFAWSIYRCARRGDGQDTK